MTNGFPILIAEDDELDVQLLEHAFGKAGITNPLHFVPDGQAAIEFLTALKDPAAAETRPPCLLISDLKMPRRTGIDVLRWLRGEPILRCLPAIIFSSSAHPQDVERAYGLGANAFVVKPSSVDQRVELAGFIKGFWLEHTQPPALCTEGFAQAQSLYTLRTPGSQLTNNHAAGWHFCFGSMQRGHGRKPL